MPAAAPPPADAPLSSADSSPSPSNRRFQQQGSHSVELEICNKDRFNKGAMVEVCSDEDGFQGAWFAATVINQ
ncbi:hypothetical protein L2E82_26995 [Cichorium intybus]|uniref:Uncharacterized protein n=1 Tax=Cichorium intybus TaxID=13427 RepID=A0ACB9CRN6_CICIN|nr:hypothetical protein L2E82_26995 [Cichorium intybus]